MASLKRPYASSTAASTTTLSSKTYLRSLKSGRVQKIVRELYLRTDIPCSSHLCTACLEHLPSGFRGRAAPFVLSATPAATAQYPDGHYLLPDTNAFLSAMDLFEAEGVAHDVIVLQTVLEEVKHRSLPLYHRLLALTKHDSKRFYVFFNDFRLETHVSREAGESINDRNDRAIRRACAWYMEHLQLAAEPRGSSRCPAIVMLSDDRDNLTKAAADGLNHSKLHEYVSGLPNADRLLDMVASSRDEQLPVQGQAKPLYPDYMSKSAMLTGVNAGTLHQGIFTVSPYNYLEGTIHVSAFDRPLIIQGRENSNRAMSGDVAVVEVLPQHQWKSPSSKVIQDDDLDHNENGDDDDGQTDVIVTAREKRAMQEEVRKAHGQVKEGTPQPTARIVGILKRNWRQYVGHVAVDSARSAATKTRAQQNVFVIPMDKRIPKIRIRTRQAGELLGKRILVAVDSWERESRYPTGHFVRDLGALESKEAETEALLLEWSVQYRPFPKTVLDCLPSEGHDWRVPTDMADPGWQNREDLRDRLICSIDPPGCVDIDDALHARPLPNGNFEVGVHIADVSHFVKPDNAMDREASLRGTTVYLVDKRIDMLPMLLGTDLCSLKPRIERYGFSVLWELDQEATIVNVRFTKSVIRSRDAFSYEAAQLRIDDQSQQDELTQGMRRLMSLSKKLRAKRMSAGALNLASPEVRVEAESETSDPVDVKTKQLLDTNQLVEEFMLLANISVAGKIYTAFPQTALLRRHPAPPHNNFEELSKQLKVRKGLELRTGSSKALADSLDGCTDPQEPFFNTLVRILATRCMMSAEYFCSGSQAYDEFRHYGLASDIYTHFTSPIRRYADLEAHRQLAAAIEYEPLHASLQSMGKLEAVCKNLNFRHRNAQMAGRASVEYYVGQALKGRVMQEDAFIMRIFSNGFVVFVPRFGIEGLIRLKDFTHVVGPDEPDAVFDAEEYSLQFAMDNTTPRTVRLFEKVRVQISDEAEESTGKRKIKLALV